jgi:DNA-binding beta-propeller fold protein YncE
MAISPDGKWVVTKPAKGGPLSLVPTGAGEARQLTHDSVSYLEARFFPDGKRVLASGIEAAHGGRDYLIDISSGDSKPVTPEGTAGIAVSPDGRSAMVRASDGKRGIWDFEKSEFRAIPGLESGYNIIGWTPDGGSVYAVQIRRGAKALKSVKVVRSNIQTGKIEPWKTFGEETGAGVSSIVPPHLSIDGNAYAYLYVRTLSEAYVVQGLK